MWRPIRQAVCLVVLLLFVWALAATWLVPSLIRAASGDDGRGFVRIVFGTASAGELATVLHQWRRLVVAGSAALGLLLAALGGMRAIRRRLPAVEPLMDPREALLLVVAVGLLGGFLEGLLAVGRATVMGLPNWGVGYSADAVWMTPLVHAATFTVAAGAAIVPVLALSRGVPAGVLLFALAGASIYVLLEASRAGLHPLAIALLMAGGSVQAGRWGRRKAAGVRRLSLLAVLGVGSCAIVAGTAFSSSHAGGRPQAVGAPAGWPNVVLVVLDTVRADRLSAYGYARPTTPFLERLAGQSILFTRAVSTASWTLPSHASMFTGRYPIELSTDWDARLDARYPTLGERLGAEGWQTAAFVSNTFYAGARSGLARGFGDYVDAPVSLRMAISNSWLARRAIARIRRVDDVVEPWGTLNRKTAEEVNREFLAWLDAKGRGPYFAFLNYMEAHHPFTVPPPYDRRFSGDRLRIRLDWSNQYSAQELRDFGDAYDNAIRYLDAQVDSLVAELERRGALDDTVLIVTSDHGEQFGERDRRGVGHGNSLYFSSLHVPLIVRLPAATAARVPDTVSLRDVPATILDLAGVRRDGMPGVSLRPLWAHETAPPRDEWPGPSPALADLNLERSFEKKGATRGVVTQSLVVGDFHYIRNGDGSEELYAAASDPFELVNLATDVRARTDLARARAAFAHARPSAVATPRP